MDNSRVFKLLADHVALDFVNTLDDRFAPDAQVEKFESYADVLRFAEQANLLTRAQALSLSQKERRLGTQRACYGRAWNYGRYWRACSIA